MPNPRLDYEVNDTDDGNTMKNFLRKKHGLSRKLLALMKREQTIFLNGHFTYLDHPLKTGDHITLILPEEESENVIPENIPITVDYEDEDIMIVNKPYDQCVHPTRLHPDGTLANGVVYYWIHQGFKRRFRAVNRLDRDTSGTMIIAKNKFAHHQLGVAQQKGQIHRTYEAIVHGKMLESRGTIRAPIARQAESIVERIVDEKGQEAVTHFQVLENLEEATYIRLQLETGRTHQIRVHMNHLGHPLIGDDLYGGLRDLIGRQALHARSTEFPHPRNGAWMSFDSELCEDMKKLHNYLKA